jgi:hypothetical protein
MITAAICIGVLSGALIVAVALAIRASYVRTAGGEAYFRGWKDGVKQAKYNMDRFVDDEPPQKQ